MGGWKGATRPPRFLPKKKKKRKKGPAGGAAVAALQEWLVSPCSGPLSFHLTGWWRAPTVGRVGSRRWRGGQEATRRGAASCTIHKPVVQVKSQREDVFLGRLLTSTQQKRFGVFR